MNTVGDAAEFLSGGTPKKSNKAFWDGDIPWFSASNMSDKFLVTSDLNITEQGLKAGSRMAPSGATLLLVRGSGLFNHIPICFADRDVAFNQDVKAIVAKDGVDPLYLHYTLEAHRRELANNLGVTGIGAGKFDTDFLKQLSFVHREKGEQEEIGRLASAYDRKIELNRRMNETLEEMARALFRDWFVDFGPTRRQIEGETSPAAIMGHAFPPEKAETLAPLFPAKLGDDGLPEGWTFSDVGSEFDVVMGQSPPGDTYNEIGEGLPFFQGRRDFGFRFPSRRVYCTDPKRISGRDWTLLSVRAPVGDINRAAEKCAIGRGVGAFLHKGGLHSFTYYTGLALRAELQSYDKDGTVFGSINQKQFKGLQVVVPEQGLAARFDEIAKPLDDKIRLNTKENQTLAEMRDLLLPKLMSGEIRLKDGEAAI